MRKIAALAGITEYFDYLHKHHFGESDLGLHERARQTFELVGITKQNSRTYSLIILRIGKISGYWVRIMRRRAACLDYRLHARAMPSKHIAEQLADSKIESVQRIFTLCDVLRRWGWTRQTVSCV